MSDTLSQLHVLVVLAGLGSGHRPLLLDQNLFSKIRSISRTSGALSDPDLSLSDSVIVDVLVELVVVELLDELRAELCFSVSHRRFLDMLICALHQLY